MSFDSSDEDDIDPARAPPSRFKFQPIPRASRTGILLISGLPGARYKETRRRLDDDLKVLKEEGVDCIVPLVTEFEMRRFKVPNLLSKYKDNGFDTYHCPIEDGLIPGQDQAAKVIFWIQEALNQEKKSDANQDLSGFSESQHSSSLSDLTDESRPIKVSQFDESGTQTFGNLSPDSGPSISDHDEGRMDNPLNIRHRSEDMGLNMADDDFQSRNPFGSNSKLDMEPMNALQGQNIGSFDGDNDMDDIDRLLESTSSHKFKSGGVVQGTKPSNSMDGSELLPLSSGDVEASRVMEGLNEDRITAEIEDLQAKLGSLQANIDKVLSEVA
eukprot:TCALIF_07259-PA protein Name:"Similar to Cdkn3 Cyclin-dependent kinase inhibitor 3 (Mus musculus)" AED:0.17 eAED:0.17 QI:0/0/0/1/1/1/2/0/327